MTNMHSSLTWLDSGQKQFKRKAQKSLFEEQLSLFTKSMPQQNPYMIGEEVTVAESISFIVSCLHLCSSLHLATAFCIPIWFAKKKYDAI